MDKNLVNKIVDITFEWCYEKFGVNKGKPTIIVTWDDSPYYGLFFRIPNDEAIILIYPNVCGSISRIVRTIIHEYKHYLQFNNYKEFLNYGKTSKKYEYDQNPYELECLEFETMNHKSCYNHILYKKKNILLGI